MEKENETMMDLAVINGLVFIEGGFRKADVGIKDGKFALIAEPGCLPEAERTIDAGGKYVLPGGIDTMYIIVILATGSVKHLRLVPVQQQPVDVQHSLSIRFLCRHSGTERS